MIESENSRKDKDFFILMSTYLLNEDYSTIENKMTLLAEQGQINAVQYFYLMKKEYEVNKKIDENLKAVLNKQDFEVDLATKHYLLAKKRTDEYFPNKYSGVKEIEEKDVLEIEKACFKKIKAQLSESKSPVLFERYAEIKVLLGKKLTQTDKSNLKKVQTSLLQEYKKNPKNTVVAFALGKSLLLFNEEKELILLGKQILSEISTQELSKQLKEDAFELSTKFLKIVKQKQNSQKVNQKQKEAKSKSNKQISL